MVGASPELYARIEPLLYCMRSDVTHCGAPGAGQAVKLLNNMVLSVTVLALAAALAVRRPAAQSMRRCFSKPSPRAPPTASR